MESGVTDAVAGALALHRQGELEQAGKAYQSILEGNPDNADVLNYFGMLEFQRGNSNIGIELTERCLSIDPDHAPGCNNLANMYFTTYRIDEAERYYRKSIKMDGKAVQPLHNMAIIEKARRNYEAAAEYFQRVLALDPGYIVSLSALADLRIRQGHLESAFEMMKALLDCETTPGGQKSALLSLAKICLILDKKAEAIDIYDQWLQLFPGDPMATHMLAAVSGDEVPEKPDKQYIKELFDSFSSSFDSVLHDLDYQAPQKIQEIVESLHQKTASGTLNIIDAGCGTGLCGSFLKPLAANLAGVDLSPGMLARANFRNLYDELIEQDLTDYLQEQSGVADLIVCADTLCYFGAITHFLKLSLGALTPGGCLVFTVERYDGQSASGYHLEPHGRYRHTLEYLQQSILDAGFNLDALHEPDLRMERGEAVRGYLVVAIKPVV